MTAVLAVAIVGSTVLAIAAPAPAAPVTSPARAVPAPFAILLTDTEAVPATANVATGQTIELTNAASETLTVTSAIAGLFDSGPIPPGGGFTMALPLAGTYAYSSTSGAGFVAGGTIVVGRLAFDGPDHELVRAHLPELAPPPSTALDDHPVLSIVASRNRILVALAPTATVGQANTLLERIDATVVGTIPAMGVAIVEIADPGPGSFAAVDAALEDLRGDPAVLAAALDKLQTPASVPRTADPSMTGPTYQWAWEQPTTNAGAPMGQGGNWGLESARVPLAWNWLDVVSPRHPTAQTVLLDAGVSAHPDLAIGPPLNEQLCYGLATTTCSVPVPDDHQVVGNHANAVASIVGARHDDQGATPTRSAGISGWNPTPVIGSVPFGNVIPQIAATPTIASVSTGSSMVILGQILQEKGVGRQFPDLRLINISLTFTVFATPPGSHIPSFSYDHGGELCGPNTGDDQTSAAQLTCTPNNYDPLLLEIEHEGIIVDQLVSIAAQKNVMIVKATANDGAGFCDKGQAPVGNPRTCPLGGTLVPPDARRIDALGWASVHGTNAVASPVVLVEAIDPDLARSSFSNVGGAVSAPGSHLTVAASHGYDGASQGTSYAGPAVAGVLGSMIAYRPQSTIAELRAALIGTARHDTTGGAAPRVDAYAAMLATPGAVRDLVDINDPSADGNRRVARGSDGAEVDDVVLGTAVGGVSRSTAPDGRVDLRDFRRYRDAWLTQCVTFATVGCPDPANIRIDGRADHPKRDLNLDRCVAGASPDCPVAEVTWSRYDFNGDGKLDRLRAPVPITTTGAPAPGPGTPMSDLDVLWTQFETDPARTDGYRGSDLPALMMSGDLDVHVGALQAAGATDVSVKVSDASDPVGRTSVIAGVESAVLTRPVGAAGKTVTVTGSATVDGRPIESAPVEVQLRPGEDVRVDLCVAHVALSAEPPELTADGNSTTTIAGQIDLCDGPPVDLDGLDAEWALDPAFPTDAAHARLGSLTSATNPSGVTTTTLHAGTTAEDVPVTVRIRLRDGRTIEGRIVITIKPPLKVWYRWSATPVDVDLAGTNHGDPLCATAVYPGCYTYEAGLPPVRADDSGILERSGSLTLGASGVVVDETVGGGISGVHACLTSVGPPGQAVPADCGDGEGQVNLQIPAAARHRYAGVPVPGISIERVGDQVSVDGLDALDELSYPVTQLFNFAVNPPLPISIHVPQMVMGPYNFEDYVPAAGIDQLPNDRFHRLSSGPDGSTLRLATGTGDVGPAYAYCSTDQVVVDEGLAYRAHVQSPVAGGDGYFTRREAPLGGPGVVDLVLPSMTGTITWSVAFSAMVTQGDAPPPVLAPPVCNNLEADFRVDTPTPAEGSPVAFADQSTMPNLRGASWHWDFGDGTTATGRDQSHVYADSGVYAVEMRVTDGRGVSASHSTLVEVHNVAPTVAVGRREYVSGAPVELELELGEAGERDAQALAVDITSTSFPSRPVVGHATPAGRTAVGLGVLPDGIHALHVTVRDKDGGTASVDAAIVVTPSPALPGAEPREPLDHPAAAIGPGAVEPPRSWVGPATNAQRAGIHPATAVIDPAPSPASDAGVLPADLIVPAFTVSDLAPATGASVTITNRSRVAGAEVGATVGFGDGRPDRALPPSGSVASTVLVPGRLAIHLTPTAGPLISRDILVGGPVRPPTVAYVGPTSAVQGSIRTVAAQVTAGGAPVSGRLVTFTVATVTGSAVTGANGRAQTDLRLDLGAGAYQMVVEVPPTGAEQAATTSAAFQVTANGIPIASTSGPYESLVGDPLRLAATGSSDPDGDPLTFGWDLDGDGDTTEVSGAAPEVPWIDVESRLCGGSCVPGSSYDVLLRVTDARGSSSDATATVTFRRDFALAVDPPSAVLNPGGSVSFLVGVVSTSGFADPVALSAPGLPAGVTAAFEPSAVTPNGTSLLTLTAAANATATTTDLVVRGTSGTTVRETARSITLELGLVPVCYGAVDVTVRDAATGDPVPGATQVGLSSPVSDASGVLHISPVGLGRNNTPLTRPFTISAPGYFTSTVYVNVGCGPTATAALPLTRIESGSLAGRVVVGVPDPFDRRPERLVTPTETPVAGAEVNVSGTTPALTATTPADGTFAFPTVTLPPGNAPTPFNTVATVPGYWPANAQPVVSAGEETDVVLAVVPQCTAGADIRVLDATTRTPLAGAAVRVDAVGRLASGTTGVDGRVRLDGILLDTNNASATRLAVAEVVVGGVSRSANATFRLAACGSTGVADILVRTPVLRTGTIEGTVTDETTGAPLAGVDVSLIGGGPFDSTDAAGRYRIDEVFVGYDSQTSRSIQVQAYKNGYFPVDRGSVVRAGAVTIEDFSMVAKATGSVTGVVRNGLTGAVVAGADVTADGNGTAVTDASGRYRVDGVVLGPRNEPTTRAATARASGFWVGSTTFTATAGAVATADVLLPPRCAPAEITGRVVNALTGQPLPDANVSAARQAVSTGPDGRFRIADIDVEYARPFGVDVLATKSGFAPASRSVTAFCGARIEIDFAASTATDAALLGRVTRSDTGAPVAGAFVGTGFGGTATTDADGRYRIADARLAPGGAPSDWDVTVEGPFGSFLRSRTVSAHVEAGTETTVDVVLDPYADEPPPTTTTTTSTSTSTTSSTSPSTSTTSTTAPSTSTSTSTSTTSTTSPITTTTTAPTTTTTTTAPSTTTSTSTTTTSAPTTTTTTTTSPTTTTTAAPTTTTTAPPTTTTSTTIAVSTSSTSTTSTTSTTTPSSTTSSTASPRSTPPASTDPPATATTVAATGTGPDPDDPGAASVASSNASSAPATSTDAVGTLPVTGAPLRWEVAIGSLLIAAGVALIRLRRLREHMVVSPRSRPR